MHIIHRMDAFETSKSYFNMNYKFILYLDDAEMRKQ